MHDAILLLGLTCIHDCAQHCSDLTTGLLEQLAPSRQAQIVGGGAAGSHWNSGDKAQAGRLCAGGCCQQLMLEADMHPWQAGSKYEDPEPWCSKVEQPL